MAERSIGFQTGLARPDGVRGGTGGARVDEGTRRVETVVIALIPEYRQVKVRDAEGHVFALTAKTAGVELTSLQEGQHVVCTVTRTAARVLTAAVA